MTFAVWSLHKCTKVWNGNTQNDNNYCLWWDCGKDYAPFLSTSRVAFILRKKKQQEINDNWWSALEVDTMRSQANRSHLGTSVSRSSRNGGQREAELPRQQFPSHRLTLRSQQCPSHLRPNYKWNWGVSWAEGPNRPLGHLGPARTWMGLLVSNPTTTASCIIQSENSGESNKLIETPYYKTFSFSVHKKIRILNSRHDKDFVFNIANKSHLLKMKWIHWNRHSLSSCRVM